MADETYTVDIHIKLTMKLEDGVTLGPAAEALHNLAAVMLVQAEDGLYTLGSPDSFMSDEEPNEHLARFESAEVARLVVE